MPLRDGARNSNSRPILFPSTGVYSTHAPGPEKLKSRAPGGGISWGIQVSLKGGKGG